MQWWRHDLALSSGPLPPFENLLRSFDYLLSAFRFPRYLVLFSHGTVLVARIPGPNERSGRCRNRGTVL